VRDEEDRAGKTMRLRNAAANSFVLTSLVVWTAGPLVAQSGDRSSAKQLQTRLDAERLENAKLQGALDTLRDELRRCQNATTAAPATPAAPDPAIVVRSSFRKVVASYEAGSAAEFRRTYVDARGEFDNLPIDNPNRVELEGISTALGDAIALLKEFEGNTNRSTYKTIISGAVYDPILSRHPDIRSCTGETSHVFGSYVVHNLKGAIDCLVRTAGLMLDAARNRDSVHARPVEPTPKAASDAAPAPGALAVGSPIYNAGGKFYGTITAIEGDRVTLTLRTGGVQSISRVEAEIMAKSAR
jgi:hypothetical protein